MELLFLLVFLIVAMNVILIGRVLINRFKLPAFNKGFKVESLIKKHI